MKKKKILFQTDAAIAKTGFGRNAKAILSYLYKTKKYDLVQYCVSQKEDESALKRMPWKSYGAFPKQERIPELLKNHTKEEAESKKKLLGYGEALLDEIIEKEKPDVYFAIQDIWGIDFAVGRKWFDNIDSVLWTTIDSLPIVHTAIIAAKRCKNFWVWSDFAEREMKRLGINNVSTLHGAIDETYFFRKTDEERSSLRTKFNLDKDDFVIGFVFRNQLRKSVFTLLRAFKKFKLKNPEASGKIILHTSIEESWDINKFCEDIEVDKKNVLISYICRSCGNINLEAVSDQKVKNCPVCLKKTFHSVSPSHGTTEEELNDIYNLMDVYCHPFTSGGQEMPIQEAKMAELITLVTSYSCGEDNCAEGSGSIPIEWEEYREPGAQFIKAATSSDSMADALDYVFHMPKDDKRAQEKISRKWAIENYSATKIAQKIEKFIDEQCNSSFDYKEIRYKKYPYASVPEIKDDVEWIKTLYNNILNTKINDPEDEGLKHWLNRIKNGENRKSIETYFRNIAFNYENRNAEIPSIVKLKNIKGKKVVIQSKNGEREAFYTNCLLRDIKKKYRDCSIIVATSKKLMHIFEGNENCDHVIEYHESFSQPFFMEGKHDVEKLCDIYFNLDEAFPKYSYIHHNKDKTSFINYAFS